MLSYLQYLPLALMVPGIVAAFNMALTSWRAKSDLSIALAKSGPYVTARLRALVMADDVSGVIAEIRGHLKHLPARERRQADVALSQSSENGRRYYAQSVMPPGVLTSSS